MPQLGGKLETPWGRIITCVPLTSVITVQVPGEICPAAILGHL
jgi:hypothetical protein